MPRSGGTSKKSILETTRIPLWTPIPEIPEDKLPGKLSDILRLNFLRWDEIFALIHRLVRWHRLDFWMQHQQQTNWCWAAVATSVSHFFNPASTWTQCAVANGELNRNDCCGSGASGPCNVYGFLGSSLTRVGHDICSGPSGSRRRAPTLRPHRMVWGRGPLPCNHRIPFPGSNAGGRRPLVWQVGCELHHVSHIVPGIGKLDP